MQARAVGHRVHVKPYTLQESDPQRAAAEALGIKFLEAPDRKLQTGIDRGTVVDIGPTAFIALNPPDMNVPWCKVGDLIAYTRNAGKMIRFSDATEDYILVINDEDVVTLLKE